MLPEVYWTMISWSGQSKVCNGLGRSGGRIGKNLWSKTAGGNMVKAMPLLLGT